MNRWLLCVCAAAVGVGASRAETPGAKASVERGREAVRGRPALNPPAGTNEAYATVWKQWGVAEKPADYPKAIRDRYGLHVAPYDNGELPMGLHPARGLLGRGVNTDCLMCHAGTVAGRTIIGLGNHSLDVEALFSDLFAASGGDRGAIAFPLSYARGTIDPVNPATFLMSFRDADLNLGPQKQLDYFKGVCSDPPAWWLLKRKKTRDWTGAIDARTVRLDMITILNPFNSAAFVKKQEGVFADIHAFVLSVESPKYPYPVDAAKAAKGKTVFAENCASCHGSYGASGKYPNKIVPLDELGTDPLLAEAVSGRNVEHLNSTWLTQEKGPDGKPFLVSDTRGYQAPPLDGVWATAPYFHNGSVPTVYHVLNSKARPKVFTRSYRSEEADFDRVKLGLTVTPLDRPPDAKLSGFERRKVYDTTVPGRGNAGHTYGDELTEDERAAVIEYLKTL